MRGSSEVVILVEREGGRGSAPTIREVFIVIFSYSVVDWVNDHGVGPPGCEHQFRVCMYTRTLHTSHTHSPSSKDAHLASSFLSFSLPL